MKKLIKPYGLFLVIILLNQYCNVNDSGGKMIENPILQQAITDVSIEKWKNLSNKKIYFGHMSVGYDIINGINDLLKDYPFIKLKIKETSNADDFNNSVFGHSKNGQNGDPKSKIDAFVDKMNNGLGHKADFVILKFCYVDIVESSDIDEIFKYYNKAMKYLIKKYSNVTFIHFTVPLTTYETRNVKEKVKDLIKNIIGKTTQTQQHINDNLKRNTFNKMMTKYYKDNVFDIAKYESTYPNGDREKFSIGNSDFFSLIPDYTHDGGHLNAFGRKVIAKQLLHFLSEL